MRPSQLVDQLKQLGDPSRLRLMAALSQGELTVGEMTRVTGLSQPRVSRHLRLMTEAGLLRRTPDQNQVYYRLPADAEVSRLRHAVLQVLDRRQEPYAGDRRRLDQILDGRRRQADQLLASLGIRPMPKHAGRAVGALLNEVIASRADKPQLALDLGTGSGRMLPLLAAGAERVMGIDNAHDMRLVARSVALASGLANCSVQDGDLYALPLPDRSVDLAVMDRIVGVLERPVDALGEVRRVLAEDGLVVMFELGGGETLVRLEAWFEAAAFGEYQVRQLEGTEVWAGQARVVAKASQAA
jgi:DNA-binding transcriptional ArsR family regulator